jgi:hypothetical protein
MGGAPPGGPAGVPLGGPVAAGGALAGGPGGTSPEIVWPVCGLPSGALVALGLPIPEAPSCLGVVAFEAELGFDSPFREWLRLLARCPACFAPLWLQAAWA